MIALAQNANPAISIIVFILFVIAGFSLSSAVMYLTLCTTISNAATIGTNINNLLVKSFPMLLNPLMSLSIFVYLSTFFYLTFPSANAEGGMTH